MRDDVVGVLQLDVDRHEGHDDAGESADDETKRKPTANSIGVSK